jgi:hypothetical protein
MEDKIKETIKILLPILLFIGCSSEIDKKENFPFETVKIIPSKDNSTMSVVIIKTGIKGGATVPFEYEFYFSKDDKNLSKDKLFLSVRGLDLYKIKWSSVNTIDINIHASRVKIFRSDILLKNNKISDFYYVNNFTYNK